MSFYQIIVEEPYGLTNDWNTIKQLVDICVKQKLSQVLAIVFVGLLVKHELNVTHMECAYVRSAILQVTNYELFSNEY
jgi:hypothetical protein